MKREKFDTQQLIQAITYLGSSFNSSDTIYTYKESPIHILVYEEILRFSKDEIDSSKDRTTKGHSLFTISFAIKNPYIFSAFLKIGAFQDRLCAEAKWLLNQAENPSDDLYSLVFQVQESYHNKQYHSHYNVSEAPYADDILFKDLFDSYSEKINFNKLDTQEKIQTIDNYLRDFAKEKERHLLYFLYKNYDQESKKMEICDYLVKKMKQLGVDFSNNDLLNGFLPTENHYKKSEDFFISSSYMPRIKNLLQCGFQFNEKDYSFFGNNLFISVLKSNRKDITETIIPYLKDITPKSGTLDEQHQFVESYTQKAKENNLSNLLYNKDPRLAQLVQKHYDKLVLEHELTNNNNNKKKLKI